MLLLLLHVDIVGGGLEKICYDWYGRAVCVGGDVRDIAIGVCAGAIWVGGGIIGGILLDLLVVRCGISLLDVGGKLGLRRGWMHHGGHGLMVSGLSAPVVLGLRLRCHQNILRLRWIGESLSGCDNHPLLW